MKSLVCVCVELFNISSVFPDPEYSQRQTTSSVGTGTVENTAPCKDFIAHPEYRKKCLPCSNSHLAGGVPIASSLQPQLCSLAETIWAVYWASRVFCNPVFLLLTPTHPPALRILISERSRPPLSQPDFPSCKQGSGISSSCHAPNCYRCEQLTVLSLGAHWQHQGPAISYGDSRAGAWPSSGFLTQFPAITNKTKFLNSQNFSRFWKITERNSN